MGGELALGPMESRNNRFSAAARGSAAAQEQLFAEHFESVYAFVRMTLPDPARAERVAVESLITAIQRHAEHPRKGPDVDAWLRGIALEHMAPAAAPAGRPDPVEPVSGRPSPERIAQLLHGVSDRDLSALLRALEPRTRQAVVLGLMSELGAATVAQIAGVSAADVPRLQSAGLAQIAGMLDRYDHDTEQIGILARQNAYHLRPRPGPMSDGMLVVKGTKLMVERGPSSGFLYMALKAFERLIELLGVARRHHHHGFDDDVGDIDPPRPVKRTAGDSQFARPKPTPSMTDYRIPKATPGMAGYRQPKGTPSTERLSSPRRTAGPGSSPYGGLRRKF